jgi:hypothetical protein
MILMLFMAVVLYGKTIAQSYHKEDSLLIEWLSTIDHNPYLSDSAKKSIRSDTVIKVCNLRGIKHWEYHTGRSISYDEEQRPKRDSTMYYNTKNRQKR